MLVLTRKQNQRVVIVLPDDRTIELTVAELDSNKVKLGFEAAGDIKIWRKELYVPQSPTSAA